MTPLQTRTLAGIWRTPARAEGGRLHALLAYVPIAHEPIYNEHEHIQPKI
jgi:hypothetical protein